jgi:hypothetical protein
MRAFNLSHPLSTPSSSVIAPPGPASFALHEAEIRLKIWVDTSGQSVNLLSHTDSRVPWSLVWRQAVANAIHSKGAQLETTPSMPP